MSRASAADIFRSIAKVQGLFPPGFNVLTECVRHGVKAIRLKRLAVLDVPACYDPEEKAIELDPGADHGLRRSVEHGSYPVGENFLPPLRGTGAGGRPPPAPPFPPGGASSCRGR